MKVYVGPTRSRDTVPLIASRGTWEAIAERAIPTTPGIFRRATSLDTTIRSALTSDHASMVTITLDRAAAEQVLALANTQ